MDAWKLGLISSCYPDVPNNNDGMTQKPPQREVISLTEVARANLLGIHIVSL